MEPNGNNLWDSILNGVTATAVSGFALALCMMFSFRQMVDSQLTAYRRTNKGVKSEAEKEVLNTSSHHGSSHHESSHHETDHETGDLPRSLIHKARKGSLNTMGLDAAQRILLRGKMFNVLGVFIWQTKAMSVMLVGVGVKLSMYDPTANPNSYFGLQQVPLCNCLHPSRSCRQSSSYAPLCLTMPYSAVPCSLCSHDNVICSDSS